MTGKVPYWRILGDRIIRPAPFLVFGILNVTPDSFHDGGLYAAPEAAVARGLELAAEGADVVDVGGESTRPGSRPVPAEIEIERTAPVIRQLAARFAPAPGRPAGPLLSVDTAKAACAAAALDAGAVIVNDVSAGAWDPDMLPLLAERRPGYVLMHALGRPADMQHDPRYDDVVEDVLGFFESGLDVLVQAGLPEDHVVLDPGIGFGKRLDHNLALLGNLERFTALGRPVMIGLSHKSLFEGLFGLARGERGTVTQVATALAATNGASLHRVHDVAETRRTLVLVRDINGLAPRCPAEPSLRDAPA